MIKQTIWAGALAFAIALLPTTASARENPLVTTDVRNYDGSWTEYGNSVGVPRSPTSRARSGRESKTFIPQPRLGRAPAARPGRHFRL